MIEFCIDSENRIPIPVGMDFKKCTICIRKALKAAFEIEDLPERQGIDMLISEKSIADDSGDLFNESSYNAAMASTQDYRIFWRRAVKVYSFGTGPTISALKFYEVLKYVSSAPLCKQFDKLKSACVQKKINEEKKNGDSKEVEVVDSLFEKDFFAVSAVQQIAPSTSAIPEGVGNWILKSISTNKKLCNLEASPKTIYLIGSSIDNWASYHLYGVEAYCSYSSATFPIVREFIDLPEWLASVNDDTVLNVLVNNTTFQDMFSKRVHNFIKSTRESNDERWNSLILTFYNYLFSIQPVFKSAASFSEATRRMIIDPVMMCAAAICGHTIAAEKSLWDARSREPYANVLGYGPLDLVDEGPLRSLDPTFLNKTCVSVVFTPPALIDPPSEYTQLRKVAKRSNDSSAGASSVVVKGCSGVTTAPTDIPHPVGGSFTYKELSPLKTGGEFVVKVCDSLDKEETDTAINVARITMDVDEDPTVLRNNVVEAKVDIVVRSLCQLLIQMHDSMLKVPTATTATMVQENTTASLHSSAKTKVKANSSKSSTSNSKVTSTSDNTITNTKNSATADKQNTYRYGVLTSGQSYLFFGLDWNSSRLKPKMEYFGRLSMPVFIYAEGSNRNTGVVKEADTDKYKRVSYSDFEQVVAATVMMMTDSLRETKSESKDNDDNEGGATDDN